MIPTAEERLQFLQDMQLLLDEGSYASTYKYALLLALSDLAVERGDVGGAELLIGADEIASRFIEYYWRQTAPYPVVGGSSKVLLQNKGRQAAIAENVRRMQKEAGGSIARARSDPPRWQKLVKSVSQTVRVMPLWKLQRVRSGDRDFLYENVGRGNTITLRPGIAYCLREFHGQIQNMVQGAWAREIRRMRQNAPIVGESADLQEFLFGSERTSLGVYVPLLRDLQDDRCFYCKHALRSRGEVDHFVPWARYPLDLGHNFVLAHRQCNNDKRDVLAGTPHLQRWVERNHTRDGEIRSYLSENDLVDNVATVESIAVWAYDLTERGGGAVWMAKDETLMRLGPEWRECW
jgi:hypothetical protein